MTDRTAQAANTQEATKAGAIAQAPPAPLTGKTLIIGTITLSLATFMNVLDTSIANVSLPAIAGDLGVSPDQGTWVITSFAVANAISVPLTGWLTQRYGQVRLFTASIVLFVLASLLCGLAPSIELLILFRMIQGAVAGPLIPLSQALLLASYPKEKSGTALGMWSMTTLVAPVAGPLLGGWITDNIAWPWIFYINIPVGLVAASMTWMIYKDRESPRRRLPIDIVGLILLVLWVGALQIVLDKGNEADWFHSSLIVGLTVVATLAFALFLVWELTEKNPVVNLQLFRRRNFWTGTISISLAYGTYFGSIVLLPLWLQQYIGYSATQAGMALAPVGILALILTPLVGRNAHRIDPRILASIALFIFAVVSAMRGRFNAQVDLDTIIIPTIVQGAAVSCFFIPLISLALSGLRPDQIPAAAGLNNFLRITAGGFGTSIGTMLWSHRAALHHAQLAEHITSFNPIAGQSLATLQSLGLSAEQAFGLTNQMIEQQAATMAVTDIFNVSALLLILLIPIVWLAGASNKASSGASAGAH